MVADKSPKINQKGQALFEFIIFLPIFLYMIKILFDYGDAINHSINQLKVVRGYYSYSNAGDSNLPNLAFANDFKGRGVAQIGSDAFAWSATKTTGSILPTGSCVKVMGFLGNGIQGETCEAPQVDNLKTQFIRAYSAYGVCTGTWSQSENTPGIYFLDWNNAATNSCFRH